MSSITVYLYEHRSVFSLNFLWLVSDSLGVKVSLNSSVMSSGRIEETWRLWCKFLDDYSRFEDWLKMAERTAANPNSSDVLYAVAKEELKKFEVS